MRIKTHVSIFILAIFTAGFLFTLSNADVARAMAVPYGCCTTEEKGGQCIGCPDGQACNTSEAYCIEEDGFFSFSTLCDDSGGDAICTSAQAEFGCCVVEPGSCVDDLNTDQCFFGFPETPQIWVPGQSCSAVPQCEVVRNIPTLSNWALIVTAGVLVLVGIWGITRKRAEG